ncbi:MAG: hypothetical protein WAU91_17465 [Desulfatitalea sp.]
MKRKPLTSLVFAGSMVLLILVFAVPALAAEKIVTGQVNDNYQIVANGQIYEIADTATGGDLAENHVNAKVQVRGTVQERDDMKIITVISYKVLSE